MTGYDFYELNYICMEERDLKIVPRCDRKHIVLEM